MNKKQGTIRVCMEFHDLNKACPKDNFPTPFIEQILDECAGSKVFSFMDGFLGYNKFKLNLRIKTRWNLFFLGVLSHTRRCLLALKMLEQPSNVL
jgi:hypothetical protein